MSCQRCFYIKQRFDIRPPVIDAESFALPNAIDKLRKEDADACRASKTTLSIMLKNNIEITPFDSELVDLWRKPFFEGGGINYEDPISGLFLSGSIDDVFISPEGKLSVIEFKSAVLNQTQSAREDKWYKLNELQVLYYAWLLSKNGYQMHPISYLIYSFVYDTAMGAYPINCIYFKTSIFPCEIDFEKVESVLRDICACLSLAQPPPPEVYWNGTIKCNSCRYHSVLHRKEKMLFLSY